MNKRIHWNEVYEASSDEGVSWFEAVPQASLDLIRHSGISTDARIIDVGGGASRLADSLLDLGFHNVGVLDISETALAHAKARLGERAKDVSWYVDDVTRFASPHVWDLWHDRAVFHFLTNEADRQAYVHVLNMALAQNGQVIIATFGPHGPDHCSGLPVVRYDETALLRALGAGYVLAESHVEMHLTPGGQMQEFVYCRFTRAASPST
jgi:SAM-dependent methyltransferase